MHWIDWTVLPVYLVGITLLGLWSSKAVKSSQDFFMPRRFGKVMMVTFAFGTGTSSDQAVTVASRTLTDGVSAIWWQWLYLPATPFYWLIAPIMRRLRAVTTADVYALRYDRSVGVLFAMIGIVSLAAKIGLLLKGAGVMIDSCTDGVLNANWAIAVTTVLFLVYGVAGGLGAAIVTDFVQGLMTVLFSFLLLPFVLKAVGGITGMKATIATHNPAFLQLMVPGKIDTFFIAMFSLQVLIGIVAFPFIMGVCGAGRTELDGRVGFMIGNVVKRICTAAWSLTSLAAVAWYLNRGVELSSVKPDYLYGEIARAFLPAALPGLLGVFIACLLASISSSCNAMMISSAALFTENVYRPIFPSKPDAHYTLVGRIATVAVVAAGVLFALVVPGVVEALDIWFKISPTIGLAFWIGFFWRGATPLGAWAGTLAALATWGYTAYRGMGAGDPMVIALYLLAGLIACVVVSWFTPPTNPERLQRFYDLTRTPVTDGEVVTTPCTLPAEVTPAQRRMLINFAGIEVPIPSRTSLLGLVVGWVMVILLVWVFVTLMN